MGKWNTLIWVVLGLFLVIAPVNLIAQEENNALSGVELTERINTLIEALGANQAQTRESATEELKEIGVPVLPALKEAMKSKDPEVAWRAKIIIRAIERSKPKTRIKKDTQKIGPGIMKFSNKFNIIIQGMNADTKSFRFSTDPSGKVNVTITELKDGKKVTKTYSADSIEEFKEKHPEIAKEYGINENRTVIEFPEIEIDDIWEDFSKSWGRRWDGFEKQMREVDEMLKRLEQRNGKRLNEWGTLPDLRQPIRPEFPKTTADFGVQVEFIEPALRSQLNLADDVGVLVKNVEENSAGVRIGLKQWDVVLEINGESIKTIWEFRRLLKEALKQKKLEIQIIRQGEKHLLKYGE